MLHFVLLARSLYPNIVKKKFLLSHIGTPEVIHEDSVQSCARLLMVSDIVLLSDGTSEPLASEFLFPSLNSNFLFTVCCDEHEMMAVVPNIWSLGNAPDLHFRDTKFESWLGQWLSSIEVCGLP
jgi:hypothetical protein